MGTSRTQVIKSLMVLACRARYTALTFSRRKAAFMMAGESECATGSPATPYTRVAGSTCSIRYKLRSHLSRGGFLAGDGRGKGEDAACPHSQHSADKPLFSHAHADQ